MYRNTEKCTEIQGNVQKIGEFKGNVWKYLEIYKKKGYMNVWKFTEK